MFRRYFESYVWKVLKKGTLLITKALMKSQQVFSYSQNFVAIGVYISIMSITVQPFQSSCLLDLVFYLASKLISPFSAF